MLAVIFYRYCLNKVPFNNTRKSIGFQLPGIYRNRKISNSEELLLICLLFHASSFYILNASSFFDLLRLKMTKDSIDQNISVKKIYNFRGNCLDKMVFLTPKTPMAYPPYRIYRGNDPELIRESIKKSGKML